MYQGGDGFLQNLCDQFDFDRVHHFLLTSSSMVELSAVARLLF